MPAACPKVESNSPLTFATSAYSKRGGSGIRFQTCSSLREASWLCVDAAAAKARSRDNTIWSNLAPITALRSTLTYVKESFSAFGARRNACTCSGAPDVHAQPASRPTTRHLQSPRRHLPGRRSPLSLTKAALPIGRLAKRFAQMRYKQ
jgi:hypothetical protein